MRFAARGPRRVYLVGPALGHPQIIQNDMRGEAQLASSGVYMGGGDVPDEERVKALESAWPDWMLLFSSTPTTTAPGGCGATRSPSA